MSNKVNRIDLDEFRKKGYLQELNRQFLHPLGLALEVIIDKDTGKVTKLGGIWDFRNDPEGLIFGGQYTDDPKFAERAQNVKNEQITKHHERKKRLGYVVQEVE